MVWVNSTQNRHKHEKGLLTATFFVKMSGISNTVPSIMSVSLTLFCAILQQFVFLSTTVIAISNNNSNQSKEHHQDEVCLRG